MRKSIVAAMSFVCLCGAASGLFAQTRIARTDETSADPAQIQIQPVAAPDETPSYEALTMAIERVDLASARARLSGLSSDSMRAHALGECDEAADALSRLVRDVRRLARRDRDLENLDRLLEIAEGLIAGMQDASGSAVPPTTLYANEFVESTNGRLYRITHTNAAKTPVGSFKVAEVTDLAFSGAVLYGTTFEKFLSINPTTGAANGIGKGIGSKEINALVVAPSGKVYAAEATPPGRFMEINPSTGKGKVIGQYGSKLESAGDLAFKSGVLYATIRPSGSSNSWLAKVAQASGKATLIGDTLFRDVWGLAVKGGVLYGATTNGELIKLNTNSGAGTLVARNGLVHGGLAVSPAAAATCGH